MTSRWAERVLGWGLSISVHASALMGASLILYYPIWDPSDCPEVAYQVQLHPHRIIDPGDRARDLISREAWSWDMPQSPWDSNPGIQDGLGVPAGFTLHGVEGSDRRRDGRSAESAILAGLRWLARHQNAGGGWGAARLSCPCEAESGESEELTALVLQAFLAAGYRATSRVAYVDPVEQNRDLNFGHVVETGLAYLSDVFGRDLTAEASLYVPVPVDDGPILSSQKTTDSGCFNGSWNPQNEGRVAFTARNTLRLIAARKR